MKQMNQLKANNLLSGLLDIRLLLTEGDSETYPSGSIVNVRIDVVDSPVLAYSESVKEAFYYLTEILQTASTFDELIKLLNQDEYSFNVIKENVLPDHNLRDEILSKRNALYEHDMVKCQELENVTIGDLVKISPNYSHLYDVLFESGGEIFPEDDDRFNYKLEWDEKLMRYVVIDE